MKNTLNFSDALNNVSIFFEVEYFEENIYGTVYLDANGERTRIWSDELESEDEADEMAERIEYYLDRMPDGYVATVDKLGYVWWDELYDYMRGLMHQVDLFDMKQWA